VIGADLQAPGWLTVSGGVADLSATGSLVVPARGRADATRPRAAQVE
jgi:hypothetical protein